MQYEPPTLVFVSSPFILAYYNVVTMPGSVADQTWIWKIALTKFLFMAGVMAIVNSKNGPCSTY